ncbi:hypothetical protein HDU85_003134 [Gaertneriomyces sp. JEL0708]|nr:hypothetical protein HDU85_003134 [Gaertneriomyces sp. JEL0708]
MVAISIHPLAPSPTLVTGYNNVGQWAIVGVLRMVAGSHADQVPEKKENGKHKPHFTATSIRVSLNVASGTFVATRSESDLLAALGSSGSRDTKMNSMVHMCKELELVPQTHHAANGVIIKDGESIDLPFRFEFDNALPPTCEMSHDRYNAWSRYRLCVQVDGRPHGFRGIFDPRKLVLDYDVPVPFFDQSVVRELLEPTPQTWAGKTEELDWSISLGSTTVAPGEFAEVFICSALHERADLGASTIAAPPTTQAAATRSSTGHIAPAPYIMRARFSLLEEALVQTYQVYTTPAAAASAPYRGGFSLLPHRRKISDAKNIIERDVGGGTREIISVEIDGENLKHGHELKIQLPTMSPSVPTPGSTMPGRASIDRRMSTGDTAGEVTTTVQVNPSGNWGSFQISHMARISIEVADGHTVIWETPVIVAPCTAAQARSLCQVYPDFLTTDVTNSTTNANKENKVVTIMASLEDLSHKVEPVVGIMKEGVPSIKVDSGLVSAAAAEE